MKKIILILTAILMLSAMPLSLYAESAGASGSYYVPEENAVYLYPDNEVMPMDSQSDSNTYSLYSFGQLAVRSSADEDGYFNTTPGGTCTLTFASDSQSMTSARITIGGVQYNPDSSSCSLRYDGRYQLTFSWTVSTATPYTLTIFNSSPYTVSVSNIHVTY